MIPQLQAKAAVGTFCAWLSGIATVEQLVEFGVPPFRSLMMPSYPAKAFVQFSVAVILGVLAGFLKRPRLYWLVVVPILFLVTLALLFMRGEA
jgi:hypothetical protein